MADFILPPKIQKVPALRMVGDNDLNSNFQALQDAMNSKGELLEVTLLGTQRKGYIGIEEVIDPDTEEVTWRLVFFYGTTQVPEYASEGDNLAEIGGVPTEPGAGWALADHDHDGDYEPEGDFALADHDHDETYAPIVHDHDEDYAAIDHDHDEDYSAIDHTHESFDGLDIGGATHYTEFEADGTMHMHGNATVWDDLRVEPNPRNTGGNIPTMEKWFDNGAGSVGVWLYSFPDNHNANQDKEVEFMLQMPHSWAGTAIYPHIHWIPNTNGSAGQKVEWEFEYTWANIGSVFGNTTLVQKTTRYPDETLVAKKHYLTEFAAINPSASQNGLSSVLIGRLQRKSSDQANDTYTDKVGLLYFDFHFEMDTIGSRDTIGK